MAGFNSAALGTGQTGAFSVKLGLVFLYGGQIGFNYQIDQLVFGAEGDVSGSTLKADSICATVAGTNCRTTLDYLASLRARAGMAIGQFMAYIDGGVAFGGFRFAQTAGLFRAGIAPSTSAGRSGPGSNTP